MNTFGSVAELDAIGCEVCLLGVLPVGRVRTSWTRYSDGEIPRAGANPAAAIDFNQPTNQKPMTDQCVSCGNEIRTESGHVCGKCVEPSLTPEQLDKVRYCFHVCKPNLPSDYSIRILAKMEPADLYRRGLIKCAPSDGRGNYYYEPTAELLKLME